MDKLRALDFLFSSENGKPVTYTPEDAEDERKDETPLSLSERFAMIKEISLDTLQYPELITDEELIPALACRKLGVRKYHTTISEDLERQAAEEREGRAELERLYREADKIGGTP